MIVISLVLLSVLGSSYAGLWDLNPGKEALKHTHHSEGDVTGEGFVMVYQNINTNNLSAVEYMHGSGSFDVADIIDSQQKTGHGGYYYYQTLSTGKIVPDWKQQWTGANSVIKLTRQSDMTQSPMTFAYGTGWYASHPITYNSLLKDRTVAKSYQEGSMMLHQLEYARGFVGDMAVELNCTGPTETKDGYGLASMKLEDKVIQGTVHIAELLTNPQTLKAGSKTVKDPKTGKDKKVTVYGPSSSMKTLGVKGSLIEIDENYIGNFDIQRSMKLEVTKSRAVTMEDWLPCCMGGFFDVPDYSKANKGQIGIFDCTCRNTSISTFKPAWNGTIEKFSTDRYQKVP
ncbi:MAG: hypothetical protein QFX31_08440 [Methanothrix sp.]|uniref:hypothetical protein n=1 Tax=Methanothrix sp. TaxID=90426 RepID=UPI0032AFD4DD|nr:hypothetical protein [Methanothrix sp.]